MNFSSAPRWLFAILTASLIGGCSTTKPVGEWRSETFTGKVDNILIIGVTTRSTRRRVFEDQFVDALAAEGVKGTPSYELVTSSINLTREQVERAIQGRGFSGVLTTRLAGIKNEEVYRLPANYDHYRSFFGYYDHVLQETNTGYYSQFRVLTLETNLWDTRSGELIWSMQSQTMDASQPRHVIEDQIRLSINKMKSQGLLATK